MKKGDVVICIDDCNFPFDNDNSGQKITHNKYYKVIDINYGSYRIGLSTFILICNDYEEKNWYNIKNFITLKEFRKQKLNKINESR